MLFLRLFYMIYFSGIFLLLLKTLALYIFEKRGAKALYFIPIWPLAVMTRTGRRWIRQFI